jgi:hypothetical protein
MDIRTVKQHYRVDRRRISLIKFILEAYEGLAVVTTLNASAGSIVLAVAPACTEMAKLVMADLGRHFMIEPDDAPEEFAGDLYCNGGVKKACAARLPGPAPAAESHTG